MTLSRIQNVYLVAEKLTPAIDFYLGLGATLRFRDGDRWAQFEIGGSKFALASHGEGGAEAKGATIVFESDDLERDKVAVEAHGGGVLGSRSMGSHGSTITCVDNAGNLFQLFARLV